VRAQFGMNFQRSVALEINQAYVYTKHFTKLYQ
jgi:hypothetical protein